LFVVLKTACALTPKQRYGQQIYFLSTSGIVLTRTNVQNIADKYKRKQDYFSLAQVNIIIYLCIVKPTKPSYDRKAKSTIQNDSTTNRYEVKKR
jgi:hypothetical protein